MAHYKKLDLDEVVRCDFPDRLGNPLKVKRQPRQFSPANRAMTACAADRQVARLRGLTGAARRSAVATLIETAGKDDTADPDGVRYLNQVSTSVFQDADEAVFDVLDAAAKHELTTYVCQLYADTTRSKRFRPRYSRPDRRELIRPCEKDESVANGLRTRVRALSVALVLLSGARLTRCDSTREEQAMRHLDSALVTFDDGPRPGHNHRVFNLNFGEVVVVLAVVVVAFGSAKLPDLSSVHRRASAPIASRWSLFDWLRVGAAVVAGTAAVALLSGARY